MAALQQEPEAPGADEEQDSDVDLTERPSQRLRRDADLLGRRNAPIREWLRKRFDDIRKGYQDQADRSNDLDQWHRCWTCTLDDQQFYNGNAQVYVPIIRDAINARATRFSNQLFPRAGRALEVTTADGDQPYELIAILQHYLKTVKFKTAILKPLLRNGDIEGQYNLYVDWAELRRHIVSRETRGTLIDGQELSPGVEADSPEMIVDIREEEMTEGHPAFEVLHDADVLVLPATADAIDDALQAGGAVTIVRRWTREKMRAMADEGEIRREFADGGGLSVTSNFSGLNDVVKDLARDIGIRVKGPHFIVFETWRMVPLDEKGSFDEDGEPMLCRVWYGLDGNPMGCKRNPYWNDRCPLLSEPVEKQAGLFKGKSLVEPLAPIQYEANDAANERADADHYGAMPIIARDPEKGGKPLVLNLAAIWDAAPNDIRFMEFPDLSDRARKRIQDAMQVIFQSLGVNPAMLPQQSGRAGQKRNQAEVALEQSVDLLTTAEACDVVDQGILTPAAEWMVDLDHQYRDRELTVRAYGERGIRANMESVPVLQNRHAYSFNWMGAQQAQQNIALQQQGTAFINVARGLRQELAAEGMELRLGPLLEAQAVSVFGPMMGGLILIDRRHELTIDTKVEIDLMLEGFGTMPHPFDNDAEKIQAFQQAMAMHGDPYGAFRVRIKTQMQQMQAKQAAMMKQSAAQQMGAPGVPGGTGPGVAGTPRGTPPGAVPAGPRLIKGPAGMIHPDQMNRAGAIMPPRRA